MKPAMRRFKTDCDYQRIREFLRRVFLINNYWEKSWHVNRFDYWRWHGILNMGDGQLETDVFIWENAEREIVAVLNREAPGSVWLQVHPDYLSPELDCEMMEVAERHLTVPTDNGQRRHHIWIESDDHRRQEMVKARGHTKSRRIEYQRRRDINVAIKDAPIAEGYTVRSMGDCDDFPARSWVSWKAFHPDDPDDAYQGHNWYDNIQNPRPVDSVLCDTQVLAFHALAEITNKVITNKRTLMLWFERSLAFKQKKFPFDDPDAEALMEDLYNMEMIQYQGILLLHEDFFKF